MTKLELISQLKELATTSKDRSQAEKLVIEYVIDNDGDIKDWFSRCNVLPVNGSVNEKEEPTPNIPKIKRLSGLK